MPVATLIGDLVRSRRAEHRARLHERLARAIREVNDGTAVVAPLQITVGDEFQGSFVHLGDAVRTTLRLRLAMLPEVDVRHGLGWGEVTVLQERPRVEDGPAWWVARDAIHAVQAAEGRAATRYRRTAFRSAPGTAGPCEAAVEAALLLRDQQVGALSTRSLSVLRGLLAGRTQREIADELGISPSAVSQRVRADGLAALVEADTRLGEVT
jgi:DNA-binding transcriptional LysR family regulator